MYRDGARTSAGQCSAGCVANRTWPVAEADRDHRQLVLAAVEYPHVGVLCRLQDDLSHLVMVHIQVLQGVLHAVTLEPEETDMEPPKATTMVWLALQSTDEILMSPVDTQDYILNYRTPSFSRYSKGFVISPRPNHDVLQNTAYTQNRIA